MAKWANDAMMDAAFDYLDQATEEYVCSSQPADRTAAIAAQLAIAVMTADTDYTKANGDTSGRKVTVAAKAGVSVTGSGTATHVALATATTLLYVTTCTSQALTSGNTVNIPAWDIEIADPS